MLTLSSSIGLGFFHFLIGFWVRITKAEGKVGS